MKRRTFLALLTALPFATPTRASENWQAEFLLGNFDGSAYQSGLRITLANSWKTYWRNPGQSGIPPEIKISGDNIESFTISFPMPERLEDESGESFGYHDEVVFPISIKAIEGSKPVKPRVEAFFGVCEIICTPAKFESEAMPISNSLLDQWQQRVPRPAQVVSSAFIENKILKLGIKQSVRDIFVEGPDGIYFHAPQFNVHGSEATLKVSGLKVDADLRGETLRVTMDAMGVGLEQFVVVA